MKRILFFAAAIFAVSACSSNADPEEDTQGYTLSVDKTEVEASGDDYVTFFLKDANGNDVLLDPKNLQNVNIVSKEGQRVPRMENKARFIANGTYNFTAKYQGVESKNSVQIVAKNRGKYEKFHKNVAIYKATATWCQYCPAMTKALEGMSEDSKAHSVEVCWHSGDEFAYTLPGNDNDCGSLIAAYLNNGAVALPTVVLDAVEMTSERSSSTLDNKIWNLRADYPATCGIKVATTVNGSELNIRAELKSVTGGEYDLGCAILLNDQKVSGGTAPEYSHIVRAATPNYLMYSSAIKNVAADGTIPYEQTVNIGNLNTDNLSVVVFALVKHKNAARIDNIVEVKVGNSIDYVYNE